MSRPVPIFAGHVDDVGQLIFDDYAGFSKHVARYKGHCVRVTVRRASSVRTLPQNRRLWFLYSIIADWSGHSAEEIHDAMKQKFLMPRTLEMPKGNLEAPPSTRFLSIEECTTYIDRVESWASEAGCEIPQWDKVE